MMALLRTLLGAQVFAAQVTRIKEEARRTLSRAAALFIAGLLAVVAVGFFTAAGYLSLTRELGPVSALLIVGGAYLALAVVVWGISALSSRQSNTTPARSLKSGMPDLAAATQNALQSVSELNPQELAMKSGRTIARSIGPWPLAGAAVIAGYLLARRLDKE